MLSRVITGVAVVPVLVMAFAVPAAAGNGDKDKDNDNDNDDHVDTSLNSLGEVVVTARSGDKPGAKPGTGGTGGTVPAGTNSASAPAPVDPLDPTDTQCPGAATVVQGQQCPGRHVDPTPPGEPAAPPTPGELGARAAAEIPLDAPVLHLTPGPGKTGLVGLPTWLWIDATPATWGPATATAAVPGLSVTATAVVDRITWTMGDGATVTCTRPGTPYTPARGAQPSPDCGHTYTRPGVYTVSAATHWTVTWAGGGQTGLLEATRTTTVGDIRAGEMQALTS